MKRFIIGLLISCLGIIWTSGSLDAQNAQELSTLAWSPDGSLIAMTNTNGSISMLDAKTGEILKQFDAQQTKITSLSWRSDSARLATISPDDGLIHIWDTQGNLIASLSGEKTDFPFSFVKWNPKQDLLVSAPVQPDGGVPLQIWNTQKDQYQLLPATYRATVYDMAWSADGTKLAVADIGGLYVICDFSKAQLMPTVKAGFAVAISWNPDSTELAATDITGVIRILDTNSGEVKRSFQVNIQQPNHRIATLAWSPVGQTLAVNFFDGTTEFWDAQDGKLLTTSNAQRVGGINLLSWSPFGGQLALSSADIKNDAQSPAAELQIIVPAPSTTRLQSIGQSCSLPSKLQQSITPQITTDQLQTFVTQVSALTDTQIPVGCKTDLLAVAHALLSTPN